MQTATELRLNHLISFSSEEFPANRLGMFLLAHQCKGVVEAHRDVADEAFQFERCLKTTSGRAFAKSGFKSFAYRSAPGYLSRRNNVKAGDSVVVPKIVGTGQCQHSGCQIQVIP
jgi:hypothetical protein